MIAEVPVTSEIDAVMTVGPYVDDLVLSEAAQQQAIRDPANSSTFPKVLRRRLDKFFADQNISPKANTEMWVKIAVGLAVLSGSWILIYALRPDSWRFTALYVVGGLAQAFLLLNIAHDSNHNAISSVPWVNKSLNYVFDLCGINSYMWRLLHHRGHHSCINLHGEDDALTGHGIFRFTPYERRAFHHRFQHLYVFFVYALYSLDYVFAKDFTAFFFPYHGYLKRAKHPLKEYVILFASKAFYVTYMLVLPIFVLGKSAWLVFGSFLLVHLVTGLIVTLVFQTTHTIDGTYFPEGRDDFDNGVYHIFATTADYATENAMVGWLAGGLNHHIAHHLCPFVCHTHYPALTRIARETAEEFGVPYRQHPTMTIAIRHHLILLKQLGSEN